MYEIYCPSAMRMWATNSMAEADFFASLGYVVYDWNFVVQQA